MQDYHPDRNEVGHILRWYFIEHRFVKLPKNIPGFNKLPFSFMTITQSLPNLVPMISFVLPAQIQQKTNNDTQVNSKSSIV